MRNFFTQAWLGYKALFYWSDLSPYLTAVLLRPAIYVLMFTMLGKFANRPEAAERYLIGMAAVTIAMSALDGVLQTFSSERFSGTLYILFSARAHPVALYLGRACLQFANALISGAVALVFSWIFLALDLSHVNWLTLLMASLVIAFASTAMALFLGNFVLVVRTYNEFAALFQGAVMLLSGAVIPHDVLPAPLAAFGHLFPVTSGLPAFRGAFAGAPLNEAGSFLLAELTLGVAYLALGFVSQRMFVNVARRTGTLHTWAN
jgi:ABC-type polysaccharide/polyol phosphate export permease